MNVNKYFFILFKNILKNNKQNTQDKEISVEIRTFVFFINAQSVWQILFIILNHSAKLIIKPLHPRNNTRP